MSDINENKKEEKQFISYKQETAEEIENSNSSNYSDKKH